MDADPALRRAMMSSIIAELVDNFNHPEQKGSEFAYQRMLLPEPAMKVTKS